MSTAVQLQTSLFSAYLPVIYQEYLLVIRPDAGVANDLSYTQKKAAEIIGIPVKTFYTDITIARFFADVNEEDRIANEIKKGVKGKIRASFVWLDNYGYDASSGTIYIKSKPHQYFRSIQQAIYPGLVLCGAVEKNRKINFCKEPHIPIVKSAGKKRITEHWPDFRDKKYENKFIVDTLVLHKRDAFEDMHKHVAEIKL